MLKRVKIIIIGIAVIVVVIAFSICYFMLPGTYITTDVDEYLKMSGHIEKEESDCFSGLRIFPEKITEEMQNVSYYYECGNFALDNNYLIYLECEWADGVLEKEMDRLSTLYVEYDSERNNILYDEELFAYPAYISVYDINENGAGYMEYALIDEENSKVIYIYSQLMSDINEKIDAKYLALETVKDEWVDRAYNMYYFSTRQGEGLYIK